MAGPWETDGNAWWIGLDSLGPARGDGKVALGAVRAAGYLPWLARGVVGVEAGPEGFDPDFLKEYIWPFGAELAAALSAEFADGTTRPPRRPLKYVSAEVNRRVQMFDKKCVTNTLVFARETGKENKGLVRAVQAVKEDFPHRRSWFYAHRRADGRVAHYDMTLDGLVLVIRERLENQANIDFDKKTWIDRFTANHREAEAGRVIWFLRDRLELPMALAADGRTIKIDTGNRPDAIPPSFRPRLIEYGPEIADLLRRNGLIEVRQPQLSLDLRARDGWADVMRDAWGQ